MRILALLTAFIVMMLLFAILTIRLNLQSMTKGLNTVIDLDFRLLFFRSRISITIPEDLIIGGLSNLVLNLAMDMMQGTGRCQPTDKAKGRKRYGILKHVSRETLRHYIVSFSAFLRLKRCLQVIVRAFYQKIKIHWLQVDIELGGRDAAETGILSGLFWSMFGYAAGNIAKGGLAEKDHIQFQVIPDFAQIKFISRINCILTTRISHIIFIVYQFVHLMIKNRRNQRYGGTSY
ncbi:DUF2953 domain-containing protein [Dehalobacter sp. DCM]|uniref:DUF2953 domain-containing protein n=1 Tax=Dehalobacter sp. DCM TaxID=2907827 RepID=UPI003081D679|nr:DUF2953 domain-containing protein [Dehalobacter sp. DCM]